MPRRKQDPTDDKVTAADIIAFIENVCFIPEGKHVGKKLELFEWQKAEIRRIYDNSHGTRRAIISMGRKNAKTTLAACLLLAHLCGPPARTRPNSQLYSAAQSRDQLTQAAVPLYLGRVAAFQAASAGVPPAEVEQALEELGRSFERSRPELVRLWTRAAR